MYRIRSSPLPSVQYATPRPESWRGDMAARLPSRTLCAQISSPVFGIERDDGPSCAGRRVEHALHHERRAFELVLRERPEVVGLEPPRDLELAEVRGVDLIERRVTAPGEIRRVVRPLAVPGARLPGGRRLAGKRRGGSERRREPDAENHEQRDQHQHRPPPSAHHCSAPSLTARGAPPPLARAAALEDSLSSRGPQALPHSARGA